MLLGTIIHTAGNATRRGVDYCEWLEDGRTLSQSGFSAILLSPAPADVTIDRVSATPTRLYYWVSGGSVNETFTVEVQAKDTLGEVVIDTIDFTVVAR
ncbi:MAG: hypothetical protein KGL39_41905 [Patescibacteria group bacterium]|nr:hypothetical protein [Patescibacteria group bacterium]